MIARPAQSASGPPGKHPVTSKSDERRIAAELARVIDDLIEHLNDTRSWETEDEPLYVALWILHTWFLAAYETTVYLDIRSYEPDAGKTTLALAIKRLCPDARLASPTVAAIGRFLKTDGRTLLIDQIHNLSNARSTDKETLVSNLANGHTRGADSMLTRADGTPDFYEQFYPKAFFGLMKSPFPPEIDSRCYRIIVKPGTYAEQNEREIRQALREPERTGNALHDAMQTLAETSAIDLLREARKSRESRTLNNTRVLINREADNWRALFTIADLADIAGRKFGKRIRGLAENTCANDEPDTAILADADRIDDALRTAMRTGMLPVDSYLGSGKFPLPTGRDADGLMLANADFGWDGSPLRRKRNFKSQDLPAVTLFISMETQRAELRIVERDLKQICPALSNGEWSALKFKQTYRDAGRLHAEAEKMSVKLSLYAKRPTQRLVCIDISHWLWEMPGSASVTMIRAVEIVPAAENETDAWKGNS